ncbi:MAG: DALR anticodon-binding domain-containing protein, partial [Thermacetogeniaceae bacterium]
YKGGEPVRMSKRSGEYITLRELIDDVGKDAARYFFVNRSSDSHLDFDLDLAREQSSNNPVYYVQYAHARICSILRQAGEIPKSKEIDLSLLTDPTEHALLEEIAELPSEVGYAALNLEPHRLTHYVYNLANLFHGFYTNCHVLNAEAGLREARLALVNACRITLRNTLRLIGVSAPERM